MAKTSPFGQVSKELTLPAEGSRVGKPTVLLVATERWFPTARMGMALTEAGCQVDAVCPAGHPIRLTQSVRWMFKYKGLRPLASLVAAIHASRPDLVVPTDDLATRHLYAIHQLAGLHDSAGQEICTLIERSLGPPESFSIVSARNAFMQVAKEEGIRVPRSAVITNTSDLYDCIALFGLPIVLKANGTSGGNGVEIADTVSKAERSFRKLQSPPLLARAVKRAVVDRDLTLLWPSLFRQQPIVTAQAFILGHEATSTLFCWKGKVQASLHFEVLRKIGRTGHATVVRRVDHPELSAVANKVAARLQLSGFHGLDFMIEDASGRTHLIEINPRTTQVGHLALGEGRNLPAAVYSVITGRYPDSCAKPIENDTIALFPKEWIRNPHSAFLQSAYQDVPWQEVELFRECLNSARLQRRWYSGECKDQTVKQTLQQTAGTESSRGVQQIA